MSGTLQHSPADVIHQALVDLLLGVEPSDSPNMEWPVYVSSTPNLPDNLITITDTSARDNGRVMFGDRQEMHGFQVLVRGVDHRTGYQKSRAIAVALDAVYLRTVRIDGVDYLIHSVTRTTDVLALGTEVPASKRQLFSLNAVVTVRQQP